MKTIRRGSLIITALIGHLSAQSRPDSEAPEAPVTVQIEAELGIDPAKIRFVPPPPPKAAPPMEIRSAAVHHLPDRTLTVVRAEPSTLPDVPEPPLDRKEAATNFEGTHRKTFTLGLSAVVYDRKISQVSWSDPRSKEAFEAWCDWDWSLVAPMHTIKSDEVDFSIFFSPYHVTSLVRRGILPPGKIPDHPPIPPGGFVFTKGDPNAGAGKPVIESIQGFHDRNKVKLEALRDAREQYRKDAAAWRKANPPKPENHTIWLKPHRGSRYLPKTEMKADPTNSHEEGAR